MSAMTQPGQDAARYFVPAPSRHPVSAAIGLLFVIFGAGQWINGAGWGKWLVLFGFAFWAATLFQWFRDAASGKRARPVRPQRRRLVPLEHELVHLQRSDVLRRVSSARCTGRGCIRCRRSATSITRCCGPTSGPCGRARCRAPASAGHHRVAGAASIEPFRTMGPWPIPTINTALLLSSGVTLTIAHHALIAEPAREDDRLHVGDAAARRHVRRPAGLRVRARVLRPEPASSTPASTARRSSC